MASLLVFSSAPAHGATVAVAAGTTPETTIFPNDRFSVADSSQLTGRRINLPMPTCDDSNRSICDGTRVLNRLDGFDLQPRVTIPFTGPIDISSINDESVFIAGADGSRTGLTQLVFDPASSVFAGTAKHPLKENSAYAVVVTGSVRDSSGAGIDACGGTCTVPFHTMSAAGKLDRIRRALDSGSAYTSAGITDAERNASFDQAGTTEVFPAPTVTRMARSDQVKADPAASGAFTDPNRPENTIPNSAVAGAGYYAFGSVVVPDYQGQDATINDVPSSQAPAPAGKRRIGFTLIVPAGTAPAGGWPTLVFGPGFTRSKYDLFLAADYNAARGFATISTDPAGHAFGPESRVVVDQVISGQGPRRTTLLGYGQGRDLDGDGVIGDSEGVQPLDHKTYDAAGNLVADDPSPKALVGLRDGLIQSVVNNMALVRTVERGVDLLGDGSVKLSTHVAGYYGVSFGGIYGTMLMATDPHLSTGLLNVPGGPIVDIARLSGFRDLLAFQLKVNKPNLLNGGPGLNGFTESIPLRLDPPMTNPVPGAMLLQEYLQDARWAERAGDPVTFAPLLKLRPLEGQPAKKLVFQTAFGDHTVPNPTAGELYRAGDLYGMVTYYRNDRTPSFALDPHGFLEDPRLTGRSPGQLQEVTFFASGGTTVVDPDGPGPVFEVPITNPGNLDCLHYPDPQTGQGYPPTGASGECPAAASSGSGQGSNAGSGSGSGSASSGSGQSQLPFSSGSPTVPFVPLGAAILGALLSLAAAAARFTRRG